VAFCKRADGLIDFDGLPNGADLSKKITDFHSKTSEWKDAGGKDIPERPEDLRSGWSANGKKGWGPSGTNVFNRLYNFENKIVTSLPILKSGEYHGIKNALTSNGQYEEGLSYSEALKRYKALKGGTPATDATISRLEDALAKYKAGLFDVGSDCSDANLEDAIGKLYSLGVISIEGRAEKERRTTGPVAAALGFGDRTLEEATEASDAVGAAVDRGALAAALITNEIPKDFKEQCIFLSQIFQFTEYHRDFQGGKAGDGSVDAKDVDTRQALDTARGGSSSDANDITLKKLPYAGGNQTNSSLVVEGEPFGFINKLTQYRQMAQYFEATNAQLAHLQPLIRLFKVIPEGKKEVQIPFKFNTFAEQDDRDMLQKKDKRGFGVGLESFNFAFDGNNPFSVKKSIEANLTIKAANFSELIRPRSIQGRGFKYVDLALKTGKSIKEKTGNKDLDFRIKAIVGVAVPNGTTTSNFGSISQAVKNNYVTLNLTPVTHTFDFDDTGAVTFKVEYRAYIEEYFDKARMNIFAQPEINKSVIERRLAIRTQKKNCTDEAAVKKLNEFIESDAENVKQEKLDSLKFLTSEMNKKKYIYFLSLTTKQFLDMVRRGPFSDLGDIRDSISLVGTTTDDMNKELEESFNAQYAATAGKDSKNLENSFKLSGIAGRQIAFFYLGDLVDLILEKIDANLANLSDSLSKKYQGLEIDDELLKKEKEILENSVGQFKKFRVVLGPLEIVDHKNQGKSKMVSFADIPISLNYFNEWMTSKLLAKDQAAYPLTQFLNDIMNDLVRNYLNDDSCFSFNTKQKVRVFQSTITSYKQPKQTEDDISRIAISDPRRRLDLDTTEVRPILNIGGHRNFRVGGTTPDRENHFFIFYAGRVQPKEFMTGNRRQDQSRGIFHYILGRDKGIVKNIKLNKTDSPGLKEVRFEQEGYDGLYQLREIYDVNIDTFANIHTFPGTYIYVDPRGFSPSLGGIDLDKFDLTDLGIGGYYMIINSQHEFKAGTLNTSLTAKWVQSLDAANPEDGKEAESSGGSGDSTVKKCSVAAAGGA
jgi:hypothetical protein